MNDVCFIVRDKKRQQLGYFYYEQEPGRRSAGSMLTKDEAAAGGQLRQAAGAFAEVGGPALKLFWLLLAPPKLVQCGGAIITIWNFPRRPVAILYPWPITQENQFGQVGIAPVRRNDSSKVFAAFVSALRVGNNKRWLARFAVVIINRDCGVRLIFWAVQIDPFQISGGGGHAQLRWFDAAHEGPQ